MKKSRIITFLLLQALLFPLSHSAKSAGNAISFPTSLEKVPPGPWGDLDFFPLTLEPSDFFISLLPDFKLWSEGTVWKFLADDPNGVRAILIDAGLPEPQADRLTSPEFLTRGIEYLEVRPPEEVIEGLNSDQRFRLYAQLMPAINQNPFHTPFSLMPGGVRQNNLVPSGVPPEQIDLIEKLTFQKGSAVKFADISYLFEKAKDDSERWRIAKMLCREVSLSVRLNLSTESNLTELVKYWGANGRNKDILPILESVLETPGVDRLDIVHLLPPTPRKLLHTYPPVSGYGIREDLPDCFWTSFAFFAENPPDRHLDFVGHVLEARYLRAQQPFEFGDLILMIDEETGKWRHACNYLAGDLVFTKNGHSMGRPWVIDRLDRVANSYLQSEALNIVFFRLKPEFRR